MIMGELCTRRCPFCDVGHGRPLPLDSEEPLNLAKTIAALKLAYVVITSVDRDDLRDGGAQHFVDCIRAVREHSPATRIEVLVPDFRGRLARALDVLSVSPPDVMNHNLETVPRLYKQARPGADYAQFARALESIQVEVSRDPDQVRPDGGSGGDRRRDIRRDARHARAPDRHAYHRPVPAAERFASAGAALRPSRHLCCCSSGKRIAWASRTPRSVRWCALRTMPTCRRTACLVRRCTVRRKASDGRSRRAVRHRWATATTSCPSGSSAPRFALRRRPSPRSNRHARPL